MSAIFDHDFLEVRRKSGNREKCQWGGTQGARHDQLGGWHCRIHGAQPTAKAVPNLCRVIDGEESSVTFHAFDFLITPPNGCQAHAVVQHLIML